MKQNMKKTLVLLLISLSFGLIAQAEIKVSDINKEDIPADAKYKGNVYAAVTWKDKEGTHYVIQTETPLLITKQSKAASQTYRTVFNPNSGETDTIANYEVVNVAGHKDTIRNLEADYRIKGLFTYHYIESKTGMELVWKNLDNVNQCSYRNLQANYLTKPIVTDLDGDKKAEIWFVYVLGCRQNASVPLGMKEVLYIGKDRFSVRGLQITTRTTTDGIEKKYGGESVMDEAFMTLPQAFKDFGKKLWQENVEQK